MTFYLKYRSQTLEELDLKNVRETLQKIVSGGNLPHAFLFAGPKGTGKTSSARILAKIVNCESPKKNGESCGKCDQCTSITKGSNLDVVELDAASHRGIDDIRILRDAAKLSPARAKKKIYIIDEAHMLTTEASNALLKTLEEPPSHVMFILATTNPEKLIETVRSRTTFVNFSKASPEEIIRSLTRVVKGENLKIEAGVLELIAGESDGSFRDAAKLLENLVSQGSLELEVVEKLLKTGIQPVSELLERIESKKTPEVLSLIKKLKNDGYSMDLLTDQLTGLLREELLSGFGFGKRKFKFRSEESVHLIKLLLEAKKRSKDASIEELPLEIALIEWCETGAQPDSIEKSGSNKIEKVASEGETKAKGKDMQGKKENLAVNLQVASNLSEVSNFSEDIWRKILVQVKPKNASVEALLRSSKPISFDGTTLKLGVFYKFHKERLEDTRHRKILEEVVCEVTGSKLVKVVCTLTEPPAKKVVEEKETILTEGGDQDIINIAEKIFNS